MREDESEMRERWEIGGRDERSAGNERAEGDREMRRDWPGERDESDEIREMRKMREIREMRDKEMEDSNMKKSRRKREYMGQYESER